MAFSEFPNETHRAYRATYMTMSLMISCSECRARLAGDAETCPECGYPVRARRELSLQDEAVVSGVYREYKLMQLIGVLVSCVGILAMLADSPVAAGVAVTVGVITYVTGLLGAWWNTGD